MKLRLRYAKLGKVRFTSHRDTARVWERALRRAGVPVATSAGFTPRPRVSFGLALPTGAESIAEYLDVEVSAATSTRTTSTALPARLDPVLPVGFDVLAAADAGARRRVAAGGRHVGDVGAGDAGGVRRQRRGRARAGGGGAADRAGAQGRAPGRRRPPGDPLACGAHGDGGLVAEVATVGRGLRPTELAAVAFPGADVDGAAGAADASMDRARRGPARAARAAGRRAGAPEWAHEKGRTWTTTTPGPDAPAVPTTQGATTNAAGSSRPASRPTARAPSRASAGEASRGGQRRRKPEAASADRRRRRRAAGDAHAAG